MKKYLEEYYNNYNEEGRLKDYKHGVVEYHTNMHYIKEYLKSDKARICEIGAGTGRYSVTLAKEGYSVDAVELVQHNIDIMKTKVDEKDDIRIWQGDATNLSMLEDEQYDLTLVLGPMYHLYTLEDKKKALAEAIRVTKKRGIIMVAYCMSDPCVFIEAFVKGTLWEHIEDGSLNDKYEIHSVEKDLFEMVRTEDIARIDEGMGVERLKLIASDGTTNYHREAIDSMDDKLFEKYLEYHMTICERQDLIGASNHTLDILKREN